MRPNSEMEEGPKELTLVDSVYGDYYKPSLLFHHSDLIDLHVVVWNL